MKTLARILALAAAGAAASCPAFAAAVERRAPAVAVERPADADLQIVSSVNPAFPYRMSMRGFTTGEVRLSLLIDGRGQIADRLVTAYSHRGFVEPTVEAVGQWEFAPARAGGEPASTVLNLQVIFETTGVLVRERHPGETETDLDGSLDGLAWRPRRVDELDAPLAARAAAPPPYPEAWEQQGISGRVVIDFYVDEKGRTRMSAPEPGSHPLLAASALTAIDGWQFSPPLYRGKPTLVRARQVFVFSPNADRDS